MSDEYEIPETPGGLLAAARLRRGLSLEDVSQRSKVAVECLAALDADDWAALPAMVYVRGFMRLYAQEVGLDPEAPIQLLDARLAARDVAEEQAFGSGEAVLRSRAVARVRTGAAYSLALGALVALLLVTLFSMAPRSLEARVPDAAPPVVSP